MTRPTSPRRADLPTVLLHWGLVAALLVSVATGWRIAALGHADPTLRWIDGLLPQGNVVRWHFASAVSLVSLVVAYVAFLLRAGLGGRLRLDPRSLRSPDRRTRLQSLNRLVYWIALALLAGSGVTGAMLYAAPGVARAEPLADVHDLLSWGFVGYVGLHVVAQLALGGLRQVAKIVAPRRAYAAAGLAALGAGAAVAAVTVATDTGSLPVLEVARATQPPRLDGDAGDAAWAGAREVVVRTSRGAGLDGGEVDVRVRAVHDGERAHLLFRWPDATRSQKHLPLVKTERGWMLMHSDYHRNDENAYYEDKFAVMIARSPVAGGNTVQLGARPIAGRPGPSNGLGLHGTTDGSVADVWHWKSVRSGVLGQVDDNHFGPPAPAGEGRYTGGYVQDPKGGGGFEQNFEKAGDDRIVRVRWLPRDLAAQQARMGRFDPSVDASDEGEFAMHRDDVVPWSEAADAAIPVGTVLPSVVWDRPFEGDRGDVSARASWKDGWWTLETTRVLDTGSRFDQPIADGLFLWVAVFDHSQVRHTRHVRPLRVKLR